MMRSANEETHAVLDAAVADGGADAASTVEVNPVQQVAMAAPVAVDIAIANAANAGATPPAGVYGCYSTRQEMNAPGCVRTNLGCFGMKIEVAPTVMFGLIDASTYSDYDGKKGHYSYSSQEGILTMLDGSRQGWKYKRVDTWSFRMLDPQGRETNYTCPLQPNKDPLKRPW